MKFEIQGMIILWDAFVSKSIVGMALSVLYYTFILLLDPTLKCKP